MKRAALFATLGIAFAGVFASQAQANTYCANLPLDGSCDQNFPGTTTSIESAVDTANLHDGPDSVKTPVSSTFLPALPLQQRGRQHADPDRAGEQHGAHRKRPGRSGHPFRRLAIPASTTSRSAFPMMQAT